MASIHTNKSMELFNLGLMHLLKIQKKLFKILH